MDRIFVTNVLPSKVGMVMKHKTVFQPCWCQTFEFWQIPDKDSFRQQSDLYFG